MAKAAASLGLALGLGFGLAGCGEPPDDPEDARVGMRAEMDRCGLTTQDLYMINFFWDTSEVWSQLREVPCVKVPQWLEEYRETHGEKLDFMSYNPQELEPLQSWADLRYLLLAGGGPNDGSGPLSPYAQVLVDFDAGIVYSSYRYMSGLDLTRMDAQPLRQDDVQALMRLLESTTVDWPYPEVRVGEVLPDDVHARGWLLAAVTRDKRLYRFDQPSGGNYAPDGFIDIYNAFWALTTP